MVDARTTPATRDERRQVRDAARRHLWCDTTGDSGEMKLYALLDAARDPAIYPKLRDFAATEEIACLYRGQSAEELASVAPYLVRLGPLTDVFDWIFDKGFGKSWGIFCWSTATFDRVRAHFRTLTKVRTEDGEVLLFRFYDPRVLSIFLPTCTPDQVGEVFGPVSRYFVEMEGGAMEEFLQIGALCGDADSDFRLKAICARTLFKPCNLDHEIPLRIRSKGQKTGHINLLNS